MHQSTFLYTIRDGEEWLDLQVLPVDGKSIGQGGIVARKLCVRTNFAIKAVRKEHLNFSCL